MIGEGREGLASTGEGGRWGGRKESLRGRAEYSTVSDERSGGTDGREGEEH